MLGNIGPTGAGNTTLGLTINRDRSAIMAKPPPTLETVNCEVCMRPFSRRKRPPCQRHRRTACSPQCMNKLGQIERAKRRPTMAERFWSKVDKTAGYGPNGDCWVWTAHKDAFGYGSFNRRGYSGRTAHRASYELNTGPIPEGMVIRHKCDNPSCVRPDHLDIGTHQDNSDDQVSRGRQRAPRGTKHHSNRLTEDQARAIHGDQRCEKEIAAEYGVTTAAVWLIRNERNWKHLWRNKH